MNKERTHPTLRMAEQLARRTWIGVVVLAVVTLALWGPSTRLRFDESIESFFSEDSPLLQQYLVSKRTFGGDEFLFVGFPVDDPTSSATLEKIARLGEKLSAVPGVIPESTQTLTSVLRNDRAPGWMRVAMRLPAFERSIMEQSRRMLISDDDHVVTILLRLQSAATAAVPRGETLTEVRRLAASHDPPAQVAGEPLQVYDMFRAVEQDATTLGLASSLLLMFVVLGLFRNLRWVLLPVLLIHITLIWTKGVLALSGMKLSMVSSMLNSLVTIICVATLMHVIVTFRELRGTHDRHAAFLQTFQRLAGPVLLTCLTTGFGFAALMISSIVPVRSFSLMMTFATLLIPVIILLGIPFGILFGKVQSDPQQPWGEARLVRTLRNLSAFANRHVLPVVAVALTSAAFAAGGLTRLQVETDFSKNFRDQSLIAQAIQFFETRMGGVGSWEIGFTAPAQLDAEFLDEVRAFSSELRELRLDDGTQLSKVISLTDGLDLVPKVPIETTGAGRLIPIVRRFRESTIDEQREFLSVLQPEMEPSLYQPEQGRMRIMLRALEQQPAEVKLELIRRVETLGQQHFPDARATGLYVLLANMISSLLDDQLLSFGLAALGVSAVMGVAFRSPIIGLISLVPNVLPILLLVGTMGWLGVPVNIGTAMIASVSMGLTVDSTIHYLCTYFRIRREGASHLEATVEAHGSVGLALVLANLALVAGFSVLTLSNFVPLADFGVLVSITMLGGLVSNIFIMPVLLRATRVPGRLLSGEINVDTTHSSSDAQVAQNYERLPLND